MPACSAPRGRTWLLCAVVAGGVALAPPALAEPDCGPTVEPAQAETLVVTLDRVASALTVNGVTPVDLSVRRELAGSRLDGQGVGGAHVSLRVRTRDMTSFVDATLDESGRATVAVTLDQRTRPGPAVIAADVWADNAPRVECQHVVREHGYAEVPARVSR